MNWRRISIILLFILLLICIGLPIVKPEVLGENTLAIIALPLGNILSWTAIFSYACLMQLLYPPKSKSLFVNMLGKLFLLNAVSAFMWGFISYFLAGNWSFVFSNRLGFQVWIGITSCIVILPFVSFIVLGFRKLFVS